MAEEEVIQEWQQVLKEALTPDDTHHISEQDRRSDGERHPHLRGKLMMKKKPERKRCGWPGLSYAPLPKPEKGKGRKSVKRG